MKTIKPMALTLSPRPLARPAGPALTLSALAGFELGPRGPQLCGEQAWWKAFGPLLPPATVHDMVLPKPQGEWLAFGRIFPASEGAVSAHARVRVRRGERVLSDKRLHLSGERRWTRRLGAAWPTEPAVLPGPVPLDWSLAFGGAGHGSNPKGCGLHDDWLGQPLPQIELDQQLITAPGDRPPPAGFGPLPLEAPERFKPRGTYDERWRKEVFPALPADTPPQVLMMGPADQHIDGCFEPGDVVECHGMRPGGEVIAWVLPAWRPRCFIRRSAGGDALQPVPMQLDTLLLLPEAGLLGLLWRGSVPVGEPDGHDVDLLLGALEDVGAERPLAHYESLLAVRESGHQAAALDSLDEAPLLPAGQPASLLPPLPDDVKQRLHKLRADAQQRVDAAQAAAQQLRDAMAPQEAPQEAPQDAANDASAAASVPAAAAQAGTASPGAAGPAAPAKIQSADDADADEAVRIADRILELLSAPIPDAAQLAALVKRARALGEQARERALAKVKGKLAEQGIVNDEQLRERAAKAMSDAASGPPTRRMAQRMQMLAQAQAQAEAAGQPPLTQPQADKLAASLAQAHEAALAQYRRGAHWLPVPAPLGEPLHGAPALRIATQVAGRAAGCDWVGAQLAGHQLDGMDLAGAFLDAADLSGASLVGASLESATLAHAKLAGADLSGADLRGANLGRADLRGARLQGARLDGAVLDQASLDGAVFDEAQMARSSWIGSKLNGASLRGADLESAKLLGLKIDLQLGLDEAMRAPQAQLEQVLEPISLARLDGRGLALNGATLLAVEADGVDLSKADFSKASLVRTRLDNCRLGESVMSATSVVMGSSLQGAQAQGARWQRSTLREVDLRGSDLRGARLAQSDFTQADLSGSDLSVAHAPQARFGHANLRETTFVSACLTGGQLAASDVRAAAFDGAELTHSDFSRARSDAKTSWSQARHERWLPPGPAGDA